MKLFVRKLLGFAILTAVLLVVLALACLVLYQRLPALNSLEQYEPSVPLRIYTADHTLIGEFGEEHRAPVPLAEMPLILQQAILAAEDEHFFEHSGVDFRSVARAALANLRSQGAHEGASTITMQVARNFYLSNEKSWSRKAVEALLAFKIERSLNKKRILEIYINQIYLGERSYGFSAAAEVYFSKPMSQLSVAESAMLAGLPKAPSGFNPFTNPKRALERRAYVLRRLHETSAIDGPTYDAAVVEPLVLRSRVRSFDVEATHAAEMVRKIVVDRFGEEAYTLGLRVATTLRDAEQRAAVEAVRRGVRAYDSRHGYRGSERNLPWPDSAYEQRKIAVQALQAMAPAAELIPAVITRIDGQSIEALLEDGSVVRPLAAFHGVRFATKPKGPKPRQLQPGSLVWLARDDTGALLLAQRPIVEAALVSLNPSTGEIAAWVGGFDFNWGNYDHVSQARRQPGSSFKPFLYSAALENGFTPATLIDDSPVDFPIPGQPGRVYAPHNYDGQFLGAITLRAALMKSRNVPAIKVLSSIGITPARNYIKRFGFDDAQLPPYLPMALGVGTVTPLELARAYAVFANGGQLVFPRLIGEIQDGKGRRLDDAPDRGVNYSELVIDPRNAFIMRDMLLDVIRAGTGVAARSLGRNDVGGKTGSTNNFVDAWFAGFGPERVAVSWIGFDSPRTLGKGEVGGRAALPMWVDYMKVALEGRPEIIQEPPPGVAWTLVGRPDGKKEATRREYFYTETQPGAGVSSEARPRDTTKSSTH